MREYYFTNTMQWSKQNDGEVMFNINIDIFISRKVRSLESLTGRCPCSKYKIYYNRRIFWFWIAESLTCKINEIVVSPDNNKI